MLLSHQARFALATMGYDMSVLQQLAAVLGPKGLVLDAGALDGAKSDASATGVAAPAALMRPASVEAAAEALKICFAHGASVVPQGGLTGLAGGANPRADDIALSMTRFAGVEEIDKGASTMTVRAGTALQTAQEAAAAEGFALPIDLGSRGSCQIGGVVATNAGGVRVIRDGMTRDNLLGLEVVLADGTVLSNLSKTVKNNSGYDLRHLFAGSEGTLGVITRAVFRLRPAANARFTALCALRDYDQVVALLAHCRATAPRLAAFEAMWRDYVALIQSLAGVTLFRDPPPFSVLVEAEGDDVDGPNPLEPLLEAALEQGLIEDALIAQSEAETGAFWRVRDGLEMDEAMPGLINLDIALPSGQLDAYATACRQRLLAQFPDATVLFYGHVGDGNLHVAVWRKEMSTAVAHEVDRIAYELVRAFGGSISAEHGVGALKRPWIDHCRSQAELETMRTLKAALDPKGILNPGKVL